jgi:hypothetical protein
VLAAALAAITHRTMAQLVTLVVEVTDTVFQDKTDYPVEQITVAEAVAAPTAQNLKAVAQAAQE